MGAFHLQVTEVTRVNKSLSGTTIDNISVVQCGSHLKSDNPSDHSDQFLSFN